MIQTPDCSFILSVEQGRLEAQAVLLVESLRRFGGAYANCSVYAISPRPARKMGVACAVTLTALGAQPITLDLIPFNETYNLFIKEDFPLPPAVSDWLKSWIPLREHY